MPTVASLTFAAATLLGTSAALAGPLPAGGGPIQTTETSYETSVQNRGDILTGITRVTSIDGNQGSTFAPGQGNLWLSGVFDGFKLQNVNQTDATHFTLAFSGGTLKYYSSASDPFNGGVLQNGTTPATAIDTINNGGLWLDLVPEVIANMAVTGAGNTTGALDNGAITLFININGSSVTTFFGASTSQVYLDIIGGSAASAFVQNTIINSFIIANGPADGSYQGSANDHCFNADSWQICGTNHLDATVIPEPLTLSLFGAGLAGAAALRRRKAKKA